MRKVALSLMLVVLGFFFVEAAQSKDYQFIVDPNQSSLKFKVTVDAGGIFGKDSDSDTSDIAGTMGATLSPGASPFGTIQITDLNLSFLSDINLSVHGGLASADMEDVGLLMGQGDGVSPPYGSAGAAVSVVGDNYNQTGNQVQPIGSYTYSGVGSGSGDFADDDPFDADFAGTITQSGSTLTLTVPIDVSNTSGGNKVEITGTIVGTAEVPEPTTFVLFLTGALAGMTMFSRRRR